MTFDWHMLYPLHTVILDNSQVFGGVPCKAQLCNFSKWFSSPRFGLVPIWELWQFCYVRIEPPKYMPNPPRWSPFFGGAEGGGGGLAVIVCTHPWGGGRRWERRPAWPKNSGGVPWARGPLRGRTSDSPGGTAL